MMLFCATRGLVGHETLEDGWYDVINFVFFVLLYIVCLRYPYIMESTDSMMMLDVHTHPSTATLNGPGPKPLYA